MPRGKIYEYRHVVGFEDTNVLGNVYFARYLSWQGRCREMFLREHCPGLVDELRGGLHLVTTHCSCEYLAELFVFHEVVVRMWLGDLTQSRLALEFEYWGHGPDGEVLAAKGAHGVACVRLENGRPVATPLPDSMREALRAFV